MLMKVDNAQEYLDNYVRVAGEMSELGKASKSPLFSYRVEKISIDDKPGLKVTMNMAALLAAGQLPEAKKFTGLMFGNQEELAVYFAAANPHTVVGAYISQERLVERSSQRIGLKISCPAMRASRKHWTCCRPDRNG